jgi:hypothetical protein
MRKDGLGKGISDCDPPEVTGKFGIVALARMGQLDAPGLCAAASLADLAHKPATPRP